VKNAHPAARLDRHLAEIASLRAGCAALAAEVRLFALSLLTRDTPPFKSCSRR
jgi:hypothetical protein